MPIFDNIWGVQRRLETQHEFERRCDHWERDDKKVWTAIVRCTDGEASMAIRDVARLSLIHI